MDPAPPDDDELAPGRPLGRFELGARLGAGGMGWVFEAHDPELHRAVAVKVLRPEVIAGPLTGEAARARLRREAQAMARVAHPNVIAVHEVGVAGERVFVVMELVTGGTLRDWLAARARTTDQIVDVFVQAGRGLAAAHDAGLVHRDFKPENVLVGDDGRARVTDFGLVAPAPGAAAGAQTGALALHLTQEGAVLGTPLYMAPEQLRGEPATAASDQFAYCVALYEALWGARPFRGATYRELVAEVTDGDPRPPPAQPKVPPAVRRAVMRGLARDPAARFPSTSALVDELARARGARRTGRAAWAAIAIAIAGVVWWAWSQRSEASARDAHAASALDARPAAPAAAAAPVQLTDIGGCAEHPIFVGHDTIVFDRSLGRSQDLFSVAVGGGPVRRITSGPDYYWNPRPGPGPGEVTLIHKIHPEAIRPRSVPARLGADGVVRDLPGPDLFAVGAGVVPLAGGLAYARVDKDEVRLIKDGVDRSLALLPPEFLANDMVASRDGRWLAIATSRTQGLCLIDTAAPAPAASCRAIDGEKSNPWFDDDASHVYLPTRDQLLRIDRATGVSEPVPAPPVDGEMTVSPDERTLVFSTCVERGRLLVLGDRPDDHPVELGSGRISDAAASADGRIAYRERTSWGSKLVVRNVDGSTLELTGRELLGAGNPDWDADGRRIVFRVTGHGIYLVDVTPYPPQQLTTVGSDLAPKFLPDGRVVFTRLDGDHNPSPWIVDADGGGAHRALDRSRWVWDVDHHTGEVLVSDLGYNHFWWWDPGTGRERPFPALEPVAAHRISFQSIAIARDRRVLYIADSGRNVWSVPLDGGDATKIWQSNDASDSVDRPIALPGGRLVVNPEVWAGDLFRVSLPPR